MPPASHLLTFTLTAFLLIAAPGPSVLFTISRALTLGRAAGVATVAGNTAGLGVQVLAVAFGVGALAERSVLVFNLIKLVGAGYLIILGVQAIRHRKRLTEALGARLERKPVARIVADGFVVGVGNPKTIVFMAAVLPQFADRPAGHLTTQLLVLGLIFGGIALISDSVWAVVAGTARAWLGRSPRRLELIGGTGGLVMIGLGATLAVSGRHD
jgi:threonine/homoserine/homoserine lactone efflux protein